MKKGSTISPKIPKAFWTLVMLAGIILYVGWVAVFLYPEHGRFYDVGLFSICVVMICGGLTGRILYSNIQEERRRARRS